MRNQAGDTIVEVLICIGIIALVLTSAFAISNRSSSTLQDSNEHAQASLYLQSQVESFRAYLASGGSVTDNSVHCMLGTTLAPNMVSGVTLANCNPTNTGGAQYKLTFSRSSTDNNLYTFTVTWDALGGGTGNESYTYRDYSSTT